MQIRKSRFMGLLAVMSVMFVFAAYGCKGGSKEGPADGCSSCADGCSLGGCDPCGNACGGGACDPCGGGGCSAEGDPLENMFADSWAKAKVLKGDAAAGKKYMLEMTYDSGMACVACHSIDDGDTMTTDADGQVRPAVSIFAAKHRTKVKPMGSENVALGGNLCVPYWQNGPKHGATPQEIADMAAYLESLPADANHATANNIDYKRKSTIPATLTGGDAKRGADMANKYCRTCHEVGGEGAVYDIGEKKLKGGVVPTQYLSKLAKRIRDQGKKNNDFMPGFPDERMPDKDLLDLLAFFEKK